VLDFPVAQILSLKVYLLKFPLLKVIIPEIVYLKFIIFLFYILSETPIHIQPETSMTVLIYFSKDNTTLIDVQLKTKEKVINKKYQITNWLN
jgi:hypothetical protein